MPVLQAIGLGKQYNDAIALRNLNLSIEQGEIYCLLGQNGAGKTTTINLLLGFTETTSGQLYIHDIPVTTGQNSTRKYIAYIPEVVQLYPNLTGLENLDFFCRLAGFAYSEKILHEYLNKAGLAETVHNNRLQTYSKGMRQKVGIAIALSKNATILLMDEPTSGLDPAATVAFSNTCKALAAEGKAILMATHDIFNAVTTGTRIGIMKQGTIVHEVITSEITAEKLLQLYLETI